MTYVKYNIIVSEGQKKKIKESCTGDEGVIIRFTYRNLLGGNDTIAITKTKYSRIANAKENRKGLEIKMSPAQIKTNLKIEGGFLGPLLGMATKFLPMLAKNILPGLAVGAFSGAASTCVEKAIKGNELYLKQGGCVCSIFGFGQWLIFATNYST